MKDTRYLTALSSGSLRGLIEGANQRGIGKDSIIAILKEEDTFIMVYEKEK